MRTAAPRALCPTLSGSSGGACFGAGQRNPTNQCEVCAPGVDPSGCVIGGVCYAPSTTNPANQCLTCAIATSTTAWSPRTGATCDDGLFCSVGETCSALAVCGTGAARVCADAVTCNGTETCNESTDRCDPGASTCGAGQVCNTGTNMCQTTCSGCVIGGVCFAPSTTNPANQCETCATATSTTAWSPRTGVACEDGLYCTSGETCSAGGACGGSTARVCSDGVTCNGTETCNEGTDRCDTGTTTCLAGTACNIVTNMCAASCGGGQTACSGVCTNTSFDPTNCGVCGMACAAREACVTGTCRMLVRPPPGAYVIPFAPQATTGTAVSLSDDVTTGLLPIGFSFRYFGSTYTQFNISSNGFIGFSATMTQGCCTGSPIPLDDGPDSNGIISAVWVDLYPPSGGSIQYETRGSAPNRRLVVSFTAIPYYSDGARTVTTQIVLYEGTDRIEIFTANMGGGLPPGYVVTQGAEDQGGTTAYLIPGRSAAAFDLTNDGVEIYTN